MHLHLLHSTYSNNTMKKSILLGLMLLSFSMVKAQNPTNGILYVDSSNTSGTMDGSSWTNALPSLADALKWANDNKANWTADSLRIYVAKGTYLPQYSPEDGLTDPSNPSDNRDKAFLMVNNVQIYGGFPTGGSAFEARNWNTNPTILSGDFNGDDVVTGGGSTLTFTNNGENTYHVVISVGAVGSALLDGVNIIGGNANGSAAIIVNTQEIYQNSAGGMLNQYSSPKIENTTIANNSASNGGGINNLYSSPIITNSVIAKNSASYGGGIYSSSSSNIHSKCVNVLICNNKGLYGGGGVYNLSGYIDFINVTMVNNGTSGFFAYGWTFWSNSIIWDVINGSNFAYNYCLFNGLTSTSNNNISSNGLSESLIFVDATNGNYRLKPCAAPINAGDNSLYGSSLSSDTDLAGNPRLFEGTIDMGAYEFQSTDFVNLGADTAICLGTSLAVDAQNVGSTYVWNDNSTNQTLDVTTAGTYSVIVTDANGCVGKDTIVVTENALPVVEITTTQNELCVYNAALTLSGTPTNGVFSGNGVTNNDFDPSVAGIGNHNVVYTYTDANGCVNHDTLAIVVDGCAGLDDLSKSSLSVFPNPSETGVFNIVASQALSGKSMLVLNALGQQVAVYWFNGTEKMIDLSKEVKGIYLLKVGTQTFKLIKK